jgi:hypothetical protein
MASATGGTTGAATGGATTGGAGSNGDVAGGAGGAATNGAGGAGGDAGSWGSGNGDDGIVTGESYASAAASTSQSAFNMEIVMGANVLGNTVDMNVVGGSFSSTYAGEDDGV